MTIPKEFLDQIEKHLEERQQLYREVDGFWVYQPKAGMGSLDAPVLRAIAAILDRKNRAWNAELDRVFALPPPL